MPGPETPQVEAELNTRMFVWEKEFARFAETNCKDDGSQKVTNLSRNQELGLRTLQRKISRLEVIVLEADKGKKFVCVDEKTYTAMAWDHIEGDTPIDKAEISESQRILTSTSKSLANILSLGTAQSHKNYARCFDNSGSTAEDVPNMKILPKVHKVPGPRGHLQS